MRLHEQRVEEIEEVVAVCGFHMYDCPIELRIKVVKLLPQQKFMGVANYGIKGPRQEGYYWSLHLCNTPQEALDDALRGFLMFWNPEEADKTSFKLMDNW